MPINRKSKYTNGWDNLVSPTNDKGNKKSIR